ncbi:MAG: N-acetylmuramoyl-L-alanine amidase [Bauldia sp.]
MTDSTAWRFGPIAAGLLALATAALSQPAAGEGAGAPSAPATAMPVVFDARVVGDDLRARFIADLTAPVEASVFTLADPYRIVVDLPEVRFALPEHIGRSARGLVSAFRYGLFSPGKSRIVIDLTVPVTIDKTFVTVPAEGQPARLVIDAVPTDRESFLATARAYRESLGIAAAAKAERLLSEAPAKKSGRPVVVIDPGHGGIDAGARGNGGTLEKAVTLAFAEVLAETLKETGRYEVVLTRTGDSFVTLSQRMEFARAHHADLFISVHANSFLGAAVRGATVYTVSERASDQMAAEMAASENRSDILAGVDIAGEDSDEVMDILLDLTRRETRNFGVVFARNLVASLGKSTRMFKIPHQQAAFKVLEGATTPSALLELGYLSNSADEKLLTSPEWRAATARSAASAVAEYFATRVAGNPQQ